MEDLTIRRTNKVEDYIEASALLQKTWQNAYKNILPTDRLMQLPADYWENRLQRKNRHNLVAIKDEKIIGIVSWGPNRQANSQMQNGELMSIYVLPEYQGKGIGKKLLLRAEDELKKKWSEATLWVLKDNKAAVRFYEQCGWKMTDNSFNAEILGKEVALIQMSKSYK